MPKPTLLILAAGMGSRYGGLKQLDPVGPAGETIIDYSLHDALRAGFGRVVFVIRRDFAETFKRELGSRYETRVAVDYAYQEIAKAPAWFKVPEGREKPWGTAHAILMAQSLIQEPFAMINADDFYGSQAFEVMERHLQDARDGARADYSMVGYPLRATLSEHGTVSRGICGLNPDGTLREVVEHLKIEPCGSAAVDRREGGDLALTGDEIVSMNFWGFTPSLFGSLQRLFEEFLRARGGEPKAEYQIPTAVDALIREGRAAVKVLRSEARWFGVTYREDKPRVSQAIQSLVGQGLYPSPLSGA